MFLSLVLKLRKNPDHQHKRTKCQESSTIQQKPTSHYFIAMTLQPFVNVQDSIRAPVNLIYSHAFNHAQAFYSSDARPACTVVIEMHVRDCRRMGACGARRTPLTASVWLPLTTPVPHQDPVPLLLHLDNGGQSCRDDPHPIIHFQGRFPVCPPLILEALAFIGYMCQPLTHTHTHTQSLGV